MKKSMLLSAVFILGTGCLALIVPVLGHEASMQDPSRSDLVPHVFQAAGPTASIIQGAVDGFRTALGITDNKNAPGPLGSGRREINWDGGGSTATVISPT